MCAIKQLSQKSYWKDMTINYNHGWRNLFQSGGAQVHIKKLRKMCVVWIGNCDVTSIEILRRCLYNIWRSKLHYFRQLTPLWKRISEPPEIQIGCYRGDPGQQRHSGSSYDLFWLNKTVRRLRHWNFHLLSFWLALLLLCDVSNMMSSNDKFSIVE